MRSSLIVAISALTSVAIAACHHDSSTGPQTSSANGFAITIDSGISGQNVPVGGQIIARVHVTKDSLPAPGLTVSWSASAGHGTLSSPTSVTDAGGGASVTWTVGDTAGTNTLDAATSGVAVTIFATGIGGSAISLSRVSPDSQLVVAGATTLVVARAIDKFGNGSPNVTVTWTTTGGSLSASTTMTGSAGNASVNFTTGATPGTYTVTATAAGLGSVTFKVLGS
jgi:adhesin/invasin